MAVVSSYDQDVLTDDGHGHEPSEDSGADRRKFGRKDISDVFFKADGVLYTVLNISLGGMLLRSNANALPVPKSELTGELECRAAKSKIRAEVTAKVIRTIPDRNLVAAEFGDIGGDAMDHLLEILGAVEQARVNEAIAASKAARRKRFLKTALITTTIGLVLFGAVVWATMA